MLPYWGSVDLLKETIDSVISQTSNDWHLTILDDHYESEEARRFFETLSHPQITYVRHPENIGITRNFNEAIERAASQFCIIIGCDDKLLPNYIQTALHKIGEADFYQPPVQVIDANGHPHLPLVDRVKRMISPKRSGVYGGEQLATSLCHGNWLYFPSILWTTSTLKKYSFNTDYKIVEDLDLTMRMIIDGATLYLDTGEPTFQYRRFSESLSSKEKGGGGVRFDEEAHVHNTFSERFSTIGWPRAKIAAKMRITSRVHELMS